MCRLRGKFCGSGKTLPEFRDDDVTCCLARFEIYGGDAGKFNAKKLRNYRRRLAEKQEQEEAAMEEAALSTAGAARPAAVVKDPEVLD